MARKKSADYTPEDIRFPGQNIVESELVHEMKNSYIEYAMSVIIGRALPDVRDGLKPVHRRILYAMYEDGLTRDKPYRKCATAVGDVLGRYHPHGDASVYDALVRLAQNFSMRYPLIDGHGNFGSVDGDPPAAYRYTEARLHRISDEMLRDIEKDTVDWDPNFDETRKEPRVLPSRFPNLLVNGSSGIAVGMATNIPPHNLTEVIDATLCLMEDPGAGLDRLMEYIKGPDFPTKGIIMGKSGIRAAYATGRGHITVRGKADIEEYGHDRERIVVTELPYQVNKRQLIKSIADQVHEKRIEGISDLRDETDSSGMRIVIELKKDANAQVVLNTLYMQTQMQTTFAVNMLALVDNQSQPKIFTLKEILEEYIAFQENLIIRRTQYDLRKAKEREHLLQGLIIAQENIDEVIRIIRNSYDDAKENLMERFGLSEVQALAILEMRLKALQGLEEDKLREELAELEKKIEYLQSILDSEEVLKGVLRSELTAIKEKYGDERMTEICEVENEIDVEDLIERHTAVITMSSAGYIKRLPSDTYSTQRRGGKGITGMTTKEEDYVTDVVAVDSHSFLMLFTNFGKVQIIKAYQIPESSRTAKGTNIVNILELESGEKVTAMLSVNDFESEENKEEYLLFVTAAGIVKRTLLSEFAIRRKGGKKALNLDEGDELIYVRHTTGADKVIIATKEGMAVCFDENDARVMGRSARGVRGIRLAENDRVVGVTLVDDEMDLITVTEKGFGKRCSFKEFSVHNRGGKGVRCHHLSEKTGSLVGIATVNDRMDLMMVTDAGILIRVPVSEIPIYSRTAGGVIVMRTAEDTRVVNFTHVEREEEEAGKEDGEYTPVSDQVNDEPAEEKETEN